MVLLWGILFFTTFPCIAQTHNNIVPLDKTRPKVGVVLSGGGAKGIAHVGTLKILEELGIPIDFIAGTSMGSIIGGLYAYGYTAKELDSILRAANWTQLLSDKPLQEDIFLVEKITNSSYFIKFPYGKGSKSLIPIGLIKGQHINNLFYTLTSNAYLSKDFNDLNIPFFCIATDILSGKGIVLDKGNLAMSMRASMAVPSIFTPIEIDSFLLVDGGIVNNFPVDELKAMGADIIIGVDVGFQYAGKEKINSLMNVLEETIFMGSKDNILINRKLCDVLIKPDLKGYTTYSFGKTDSLLAIGERAALTAYPQLKKIAEELSKYPKPPVTEKKEYHPRPVLYISDIKYNGLKKYNEDFVNQSLQIEKRTWVKLADITRGVERLYGTSVFETVTYEFQKDSLRPDESILIVNVKEVPSNTFNLGLRYDNQRSVALLAGTVLHNLGVPNSRLAIDAELSQLPMASADYLFMPTWNRKKHNYSPWKPSVGIKYQFYKLTTNLYRAANDVNRKTSEVSVQNHSIKIYAQSNWKRSLLGLGFALDFSNPKERLSDQSLAPNNLSNNNYFYPFLYFAHDSYNAKFYPTKGFKMNIDARFPNGINLKNSNLATSFLSLFWTAEFAITPIKRLSIYPGFSIGATLFRTKSQIPLQHQFYQGGCTPINVWNTVMFPGVLFGQSEGAQMWNLKLNIQVLIIKNLYITLRGSLGKATKDIKEMLNLKNLIYGGNIGISYNTPIGPIGLSFQSSNLHPFNIYIHVCYWY
ncbi:MAG: patatin-like phospholipase family protein [Bacteroidales bacterium]